MNKKQDTQNIKHSLGYKLTKAQDNFFSGKWSLITFTSAVIICALIQVILFVLGILAVESTTDITAWQPWVYMVISPLGATLSLWGYVYIVRVDKRFFIPTLLGQSITLVTAFLSGMIWTGFVMFAVIACAIYRVELIKKGGTGYKINKKLVYIIGTTTITISAIIGMIMAGIPAIGDVFWWKHTDSSMLISYREIDVIGCTLALYGQMFLITKSKYAFILFLICNFFFVALYFASGAWINGIQIIILITCNSCAAAAWSYKSKHQDEF